MVGTIENGVHAAEPPIDLRSDTVTKPTAAMREAMAKVFNLQYPRLSACLWFLY